MFVVFICSSYVVVTFIQTVNKLFDYEVNLEFEKFQGIPTKFPSVTICNQNAFDEKYAFNYLNDKYNFKYDYGYYNPDPTNDHAIEYSEDAIYYFGTFVSIANPSINQLKITLINDLNQTELSSIGYDLDSDMLISCQYNRHSCSETNGDFKRFWNNIYGNCYTFNGGNNSYLTGDQNGLHFEMIVSK